MVSTAAAGCKDTVTKSLYVHSTPTADFNWNDVVDSCNYAEFTDISEPAQLIKTWYWNFGDSTFSSYQYPAHKYKYPGTYNVVLTVTTDSGCASFHKEPVQVAACDNELLVVLLGPPAVPSAFTPNGDGHNDKLYVRGGPFKTLSFRVFNEWGNEIFKTENQTEGWDGTYKGKDQPSATYVWTVVGTTVKNETINITGGTTLVR
jgi:gliding motility-associated-like protein